MHYNDKNVQKTAKLHNTNVLGFCWNIDFSVLRVDLRFLKKIELFICRLIFNER